MIWGHRLTPTDIPNPLEPGEPLYVDAKIRPAWYWWLMRIKLFLLIVWRRYEDSRLDWRTAWDVAGIVHGRKPNERQRQAD